MINASYENYSEGTINLTNLSGKGELKLQLYFVLFSYYILLLCILRKNSAWELQSMSTRQLIDVTMTSIFGDFQTKNSMYQRSTSYRRLMGQYQNDIHRRYLMISTSIRRDVYKLRRFNVEFTLTKRLSLIGLSGNYWRLM